MSDEVKETETVEENTTPTESENQGTTVDFDEDKIYQAAFDRVNNGETSNYKAIEDAEEEKHEEQKAEASETEKKKPEPDKEELKVDDTDDKAEQQGQKDTKKEKPPETMEDELKRLRETVMRQAGYSSKVQRELNELKAKARVVKQPIKPVIDPETGLFGESWKELKEDYPDANFDKVEQVLKTQQQMIQELTEQVRGTQVHLQNTAVEMQQRNVLQQVKSRHPDFEDTVTSAEFKKWQQSLPQAQQETIQAANDADTISVIVDTFKAVTGYKSRATREAESRADIAQTVDKREKRKAASVSIQTKQPATPVTGGTDVINEDAIYAEVFKRQGLPA